VDEDDAVGIALLRIRRSDDETEPQTDDGEKRRRHGEPAHEPSRHWKE
jgi:hypothetical protein